MSMAAVERIVELRQYTLKPGRRDELIALFEREFVESQEETGMSILGTFRDHDRPDRFVWLRGFPDMESRAKSLAAFYGGPVWKAHREVANDTMVDSDNVLLLRPAWGGSGFSQTGTRALCETTDVPPGLVMAIICNLGEPVRPELLATLQQSVSRQYEQAGGTLLAAFVTEESANDFPRLPIRDGEHVFVWFAMFADARDVGAVALPLALEGELIKPPEILRLLPTTRSRIRA